MLDLAELRQQHVSTMTPRQQDVKRLTQIDAADIESAEMATGQWLKNARRRAGFVTQDDLAEALGVSRGAVGNWETDVSIPSMANAERLAVELKRSRAEVLGKFGYPIGGGEATSGMPALATLPEEWLRAIREEIANGVADGIAQVLEQLRREGLLPGADTPRRGRPRRSSP